MMSLERLSLETTENHLLEAHILYHYKRNYWITTLVEMTSVICKILLSLLK